VALGSAQPLTETSTRNLPGDKERQARKVDLTAIYEPTVLENVGSLDVSQPYGLFLPSSQRPICVYGTTPVENSCSAVIPFRSNMSQAVAVGAMAFHGGGLLNIAELN
jgi:hypothetical protein